MSLGEFLFGCLVFCIIVLIVGALADIADDFDDLNGPDASA